MEQKIDYVNLMDIAKMNLSKRINENIILYMEKQTNENKIKLLNLIHDRKKLFLFDKNIIKKYL